MNSPLRKGRPSLLKPIDEYTLRQMREDGIKIKECASYLGISVATAFRVLARLRAKLGPEKLPNGQSARSHLTRRENQTPI